MAMEGSSAAMLDEGPGLRFGQQMSRGLFSSRVLVMRDRTYGRVSTVHVVHACRRTQRET
jgi:hypothetical protein